MKKSLISLFLVTALLFSALSLSACSNKKFKIVFNQDEGKLRIGETVNISFAPNGGKIISGDESVEVISGDTVTAPEVEREGYVFNGWDINLESVTESAVAKACWLKLCNVIFDANGGTIASDNGEVEKIEVTVTEGENMEAPDVKRSGYTFTGWDKNFASINDDIVVTAQWERAELTTSELYDLAKNAVVTVKAIYPDGEYYSTGTGFFIDSEGTLVTCYHIIESKISASVIFEDGGEYEVSSIIKGDADLDIAVLKVKKSNTPYLRLSETQAVAGDKLFVFGSPEGHQNIGVSGEVTNPLISDDSSLVYSAFMHNAPTSPGSSGSPIINKYGDVVGMNAAHYVDGDALNIGIHISEMDKIEETIDKSLKDYFIDEYIGIYGDYYDFGEHNIDEGEPNDTFDDADIFWLNGMTYSGVINYDSDDLDVYRVFAGESGNIVAILKPNDDYDISYVYVVVYDKNQEVVDNFYTDDGYKSIKISNCMPGDSYYFVVMYDYNESGYTYCYYDLYTIIE